ncbi:MAG: hypothetical protein GY799_18800 [Desulfobulbaceae bacterium]|nr:hypothetical protein [Desulfobulbaceae bacterium]
MKKLIVLSILFLFISGCATKDQQTRTEGTAGGAGIGAIIGGLIGYVVGDEEGALAGAALGAALGGAVGYTYADNIANRHAELAGHENDLDARITFAEGINQDTQELNQLLEREIATLTPEIDTINTQARQEKITQKELDEKRKSMEQKVEETETALAAAENELKELKKFQGRTPDQSDELDSEIGKLEKNLKQLKRNTDTIASLSQRL